MASINIVSKVVCCLFQNVPLGGWSVERSVDGKTAIGYKFSAKYVLKAGCYVTVSYGFST